MDDIFDAIFSSPSSTAFILIAIVTFIAARAAVRIVPQSENHVVERLGRLRTVIKPGLNLIFPFLDTVRHRVSVLERQLPNLKQDAITRDNVVIQCDIAVFYRVDAPEYTVYRIRDVDGAVSTTIAGIVRSEIGKIDLDDVQSNRNTLNSAIKEQLSDATEDWGIVVTRAEVLDVNLDERTREMMQQQLNAERARRAAVTRAEGDKRAVELKADGDLYAAQKIAEARKVQADAEAYATNILAQAIARDGEKAIEFEIRKRQVEAVSAMADGKGTRTIVLPADLAESFQLCGENVRRTKIVNLDFLFDPINWLIIGLLLALLELIFALEVTYFGAGIGGVLTAGVLTVVDQEKLGEPEATLLIFSVMTLMSVIVLRYTFARPSEVTRFNHDVNETPYKGDKEHLSKRDADE